MVANTWPAFILGVLGVVAFGSVHRKRRTGVARMVALDEYATLSATTADAPRRMDR
jgi:hypothetical protein